MCGAFYGSKVWHSNDPYRLVIWQCNNKYKIKHPSPMPHPRDEDIQAAFNKALTTYIAGREKITRSIETALTEVMDTAALEAEQAALLVKIEGLTAMMNKEVEANSRATQDQAAYRERFARLETDFETATARHDELAEQITDKQSRAVLMRNYLQTITTIETPVELFDRRLWHVLVETATIHPDGAMEFTFKDGTTIKA